MLPIAGEANGVSITGLGSATASGGVAGLTVTGHAVGAVTVTASKAGLIALTKSVAKELGSRNILVNAIAPGLIETEMTAAMSEDARSAMRGMIPLERLGTGKDVAGMVAFLASEHASYITGQTFVIDGGMVM